MITLTHLCMQRTFRPRKESVDFMCPKFGYWLLAVGLPRFLPSSSPVGCLGLYLAHSSLSRTSQSNRDAKPPMRARKIDSGRGAPRLWTQPFAEPDNGLLTMGRAFTAGPTSSYN